MSKDLVSEKRKTGVHKSHCCILHGCKYNECDCPVNAGEITQSYICEECFDDGLSSLKDIEFILNLNCCKEMIDFSRDTSNFLQLKNFKICPFCLKEIQ